jgi:hypothetical protein
MRDNHDHREILYGLGSRWKGMGPFKDNNPFVDSIVKHPLPNDRWNLTCARGGGFPYLMLF